MPGTDDALSQVATTAAESMAPTCRTLMATICSCIQAAYKGKAHEASVEHQAPRPLVPDFVCRTLTART